MKTNDFHLFSFINKIELKLPNNTLTDSLNKESTEKIKSSGNNYIKNKKRYLENIEPNTAVKQENNATANYSSVNSTEEIEIVEVYFTSDMISKKQLRGNCFLQYNGFFYDLSYIKWPGSLRYILI